MSDSDASNFENTSGLKRASLYESRKIDGGVVMTVTTGATKSVAITLRSRDIWVNDAGAHEMADIAYGTYVMSPEIALEIAKMLNEQAKS